MAGYNMMEGILEFKKLSIDPLNSQHLLLRDPVVWKVEIGQQEYQWLVYIFAFLMSSLNKVTIKYIHISVYRCTRKIFK